MSKCVFLEEILMKSQWKQCASNDVLLKLILPDETLREVSSPRSVSLPMPLCKDLRRKGLIFRLSILGKHQTD